MAGFNAENRGPRYDTETKRMPAGEALAMALAINGQLINLAGNVYYFFDRDIGSRAADGWLALMALGLAVMGLVVSSEKEKEGLERAKQAKRP